MRKLLLFLFMALIPYMASAKASNLKSLSLTDTTHVYYINHQEVSNFDGSQLTGKRILSYKLQTDTSASSTQGVRQVHEISIPEETDKTLILLDGIEINRNILNQFCKTQNVKTMTIYKDEISLKQIFSQYFKGKESEMQKKYQNAIIVNSQNEQAAKDWYHKYINSQQKIQHPIYIIDGEKSALFDGSQLEGKIIKKYTIDTDTTKVPKASINTTHRITTTTEQPIRLQGLKNASQNKKQETIYILNGKKVSKTEIEKFPKSNISNIVVLKGGTKAATQYSTDSNDTSTYVVITTK